MPISTNGALALRRRATYNSHKKEKLFEGKSQLGLGNCYYKANLTEQAIKILEGCMIESESIGLNSIVELISSELIHIYNKVAQDYELAENLDQALIYYEKCLSVAQKASD